MFCVKRETVFMQLLLCLFRSQPQREDYNIQSPAVSTYTREDTRPKLRSDEPPEAQKLLTNLVS